MDEPTCRWPGCDREVKSRGLCTRDYNRARRCGDLEQPWITRVQQRARYTETDHCRWPDCDASIYGKGLCTRHWARAWRLGDMDEPWAHWERNCERCGTPIKGGRNREQRFCSSACNLRAWIKANPDRYREQARRHAAHRRARIRKTTIENFTEADVRMAHGDDCYLCGKPIDFRLKHPHPESPSLDHVMPLSRGGTHTLDNVAMTHLLCNLDKSDRETTSPPATTLFVP